MRKNWKSKVHVWSQARTTVCVDTAYGQALGGPHADEVMA